MTTKILIIEDQAGIRLLLTELFVADGYLVDQADHGKLAMNKIVDWQPDVILLDMKLPGMTGLDILEFCRDEQVQAKIVMMTAYGELEHIREAKSLGAVAHFSKPFDVMELRKYVIHLLSDVSR